MKKLLLNVIICAFISFSAFAQDLIKNGGFALPDDDVKYLHIYQIPNWFSDDSIENNNGREYGAGDAQAYMKNTGGSIYQPVDVIPAVNTVYTLMLEDNMAWTPSTYSILIVKFSAFSGTDRASRVVIDSTNIYLPAGSSWKEDVASFNVPDGADYAGDSLIIEIDFASNDDNSWLQVDSVRLFKSTVSNLILNGGFMLPDDDVKYLHIYQIPNWFSDDSIENDNGREYGAGDAQAYMKNTGGSIYQPIEPIPDTNIEYLVKLEDNLAWTPSSQVILTVKFSAFSGADRASRVVIDSTNIILPSGSSWKEDAASFNVPDSADYAGDSLVVEIDLTSNDDNSWLQVDSVRMYKSLYSFGDIANPTTPTNLAADIVDYDVTLTWDASTDDVGIFGYIIYDGDSAIRTVFTATTTISDLAIGAYTLGVAAMDSRGKMSSTVTVDFDIEDVTSPTAPTNLVADVDEDDVTLTWDASTDNVEVASYIIYDGNDPIDTIDALPSGNTYDVSDLANGDYIFGVSAIDNSDNESDMDTAAATVNVIGIKESSIASLILGPNPVIKQFNISSNEILQSITIIDITGKVVMQVGINKTNATINVQNFAKGVYFVKIQTKDAVATHRIIKE